MAISTSLRADPVRRLRVPLAWVLPAIAVLLAAGGFALSRTSTFDARSIDVTGASTLSRADIVRTAGVSRSTNVPWLDEAAAERRLEDLAWVQDAIVTSSLPWAIRIEVVERTPVAVATDGFRELLVAGDGTVLGDASADDRVLPRIELPTAGRVEGAPGSATGAARILAAMDPALRAEVARIGVLLDGTVELVLRDGPRVRFGMPTDPLRKARALERVLAWATSEGERLVEVTVSSPWAPAAKLDRD